MNASKEQIAAAFTEWERRYREEPAKFMADSARLALAEATYGELCAAYFLEVLSESK